MSVDPLPVTRLIIEMPLQGLLQGGEFVTARAREMASGMFKNYLPAAFPT